CNGEMDDQNFYSAAISAQMEDTVIPQFASALAFDFNFAFDIRPGDKFQAVYQDPDPAIPGGRPVLIYASLVTEAKSKQLWLYHVPGEAAPAWFDAAGHSAAKSLMRTPVEGAHVTSVFGPRMHPIFEKVIVHKGVDFGCPVGTSVFASADGVIEYAGIANGYGNFLKIRHSPTLETAYGHLSAYGDGIKQGVTVKQNQVVAMTGNTGNSTGPHLHYEVLQSGEPVDPLTFATEETRALAGKDFEAFLARKNAIDTARDAS
ncbi:MAG: M23 family metallopeptidase, partial [Caulobacteraceae bacterium]|nr:M23 family metallopeptidase [Caulobacteraceae bacterium]